MASVSKIVPKELLPVGGKPPIQRAIEEALASGVEEVVVVTRPGKTWLNIYLDPSQKSTPQRSERNQEGYASDAISGRVRITLVEQPRPQGLGDALLCTRAAIGSETFGLILPDALIDAQVPVLAQLARAFREHGASCVATQLVGSCDVPRFGMLVLDPSCGGPVTADVFRVRSIVEKPHPTQTPSHFGLFGRYILTREIFSLLDEVAADSPGEVQLSDALARYCERYPLYAVRFDGRHYDAGDPFGYLQAVVEFALKDNEIGPLFRDYLSAIVGRSPDERPASTFPDLR